MNYGPGARKRALGPFYLPRAWARQRRVNLTRPILCNNIKLALVLIEC